MPFALRYSTYITMTLTYIIVILFFKDKWRYKTFVFALFSVSIFSCDALSATLYIFLSGNEISTVLESVTVERLCVEFLFLILFSTVTYVIYYFIKRKAIKINKKTFVISLLFPFTQVFLICNSFYTHNNEMSTAFIISLVAEIIGCIAVDIVIIKMLNSIAKSAAAEEKLKWVEGLKSAETNYFNTLQEKTREVMKLRHEINDRIQTALILMQSDSQTQKQKAAEILKGTYSSLEKTKLPVYCQNPVCNTIVNGKISEMLQEKIAYKININIPENLNIESADLCSIFSNLINNAIESCKKLTDFEKVINIDADIKGEYLVINISNPVESLPQFKNGKPLTSKKDKLSHGFGTEYIGELAEKYEGKFTIETENNLFVSKVVLNTNIKNAFNA